MEQITPKNKFTPATIIGGIVGFAITAFLMQQFVFKQPTYEEMMLQAAAKLNESCPTMVDQETRLDSVAVMPKENVIKYIYTLVNYEKAGIDVAVLLENVRPSIVETVKTSPQMKPQRDHNTAFIYYYNDKNGEFLGQIDVSPDMYK